MENFFKGFFKQASLVDQIKAKALKSFPARAGVSRAGQSPAALGKIPAAVRSIKPVIKPGAPMSDAARSATANVTEKKYVFIR